MSDSSSDLDLKFLPDWLKEGASENRYANFQGESERRPHGADRMGGGRRERGDQNSRTGRPGPGGGRPGSGGGGNRSNNRNERGPRSGGPRERGGDTRPPQRPAVSSEASVNVPLRVDILPEPNGADAIAKMIRSGCKAYPFNSTARLFLQKPERHLVRVTSLDAQRPLFQVGDGPVDFDRALVERRAFDRVRDEYYREERIETEPVKGNFSNVARCRSSGKILGPTSYHGYQPALRRLYEERFSNRMSFQRFQQDEIEVATGELAVNEWKESVRFHTVFHTIREAEPVMLKNPAEVEAHFRTHYLPGLVLSGTTLVMSGPASRACGDQRILGAMRDAWEREFGFPGSLMHHLRQLFVDSGLHFFKHRKRVVFVSPIRPQRHASDQTFSAGVDAIITLLHNEGRLNKPDLALKLLGAPEEGAEVELTAKKAALASDLHYLIHAGQVIEFQDGSLELPLPPRAESPVADEMEAPESCETEASAISAPETVAISQRPAEGSDASGLSDTNPLVAPEDASPS